MKIYYGVIYFKDGRRHETGGFSGSGAETSCERYTCRQFEWYKQMAISPYFEPSRYEVKVREE